MKALCPLAAFSVALLLTACSTTQQAGNGAMGSSRAEKLVERPGNIFNTRGKKTAPKTEETATEEEGATASRARLPIAPVPTAPVPTAEQQVSIETAEEQPIAPMPTEAQQKAAEALLNAQPEATPAPAAPAPAPAPAEEAPEPPAAPALAPLNQSLRMGSIVPTEEAASSSDAPAPAANKVELRGLRSPKLPTGLPMGIDGKINSAQ